MQNTPLSAWHAAHGGRMVDFAGWNMPVQYSGIVEEHNAVRTKAGLFDISHMGRLRFSGPNAQEFLDDLQTVDMAKLKPGQIRYGFMLKEDGGILDDILAYQWPEAPQLVVNASNREKLLAWMQPLGMKYAVTIEDLTFDQAMIALQGPDAVAITTSLFGDGPSKLKYYTGATFPWNGEQVNVSRTGYTGEDGFEFVLPSARVVGLWETILEAGAGAGIKPTGLGCRDTLRLEAAMPLYGHELNEEIDPLTAGLDFAIRKDKVANYIGRAALEKIAAQPKTKARVGLVLPGKRIAREHTPVLRDGAVIGEVTSGTFSPTLNQSIAMAYVAADSAEPGTAVVVDIRGKQEPATVVELPFYKRSK